jgi:hypothetical protein
MAKQWNLTIKFSQALGVALISLRFWILDATVFASTTKKHYNKEHFHSQ